MKHQFKAKIYPTGINWAVDVPVKISEQMISIKGYIKIKGIINDFNFIQTLVPVKNSLYRLFVNKIMMDGGKTSFGKIAAFIIEQDDRAEIKAYPPSKILTSQLRMHRLNKAFNALTPSRKKDVLKYLSFIKTEAALIKNIDKLITQLKNNEKNVRVP
ncbi:MAG: YdeI/OmpD-associated family protein [Chryseolinea sp.]